MKKQAICVALMVLLSVGVIATLLAVLLTDTSGTNEDNEVEVSGEPGGEPMEGEYVYAEIPSVGKIQGRKSKFGAAIFEGIPFGAPPVGELRWMKTRPAEFLVNDWEYYNATFSRPACLQKCTLPSPDYVCPAEEEMDEDCLYLNIYLPSTLYTEVATREGHYYTLVDSIVSKSYPVMVFLYGGAFIAGGNGVPLYDGQFLAEKGNVIIVSVNYRLGTFGFFYQDNGKSDAALGNYAIWDQIEALRWVKKWIPYFGGNNEQVTLFGESAGAQSVAVHMVNEHSKSLFNQAILESNPFGLNYKTLDEAQKIGENFVKHINNQDAGHHCEVNDLACLRRIPMKELLEYYDTFPYRYQFNPNSITQLFEPWAPIIDDDLLFQHPFFEFSQGKNHNKPMIFGLTTNEAAYFVAQALTGPSKSNSLYNILVDAIFGKNSSAVLDCYPPECPNRPNQDGYDECDNRLVMDKLVTDYMFTCPNRKVFQNKEQFGDPELNVWWYTFDQLWSFPEFWQQYKICYNLTCHAAELPYLFDMDKLTEFRFTESEAKLAEKFIAYWTNFARYGNPNIPEQIFARQLKMKKQKTEKELPSVKYWPRIYEGSTPHNVVYKTMLLTDSTKGGEKVIENFHKKECDFWDKIDLYLQDDVKLGEAEMNELEQLFTKR